MQLHLLFFYATILLLPTQLGKHFFPDWALVLGRRLDYLSPTLFLTDITIVFTIFFWLLQKIHNPKFRVQNIKINPKTLFVSLSLCLFVVLNILFAVSPLVALYKWLKVLEFLLFGFYIVKTKPSCSRTLWCLSFAVLYSSIIAIAQFILQHSVGGLLWFLGERTFDVNTPGIATIQILPISIFPASPAGRNFQFSIFNLREFLRPYATFPHPNVLGGFLAVTLPLIIFNNMTPLFNKFLLSQRVKRLSFVDPLRLSEASKAKPWAQRTIRSLKIFWTITIILGCLALILTFSRSSWMAGIIGLSAVLLLHFKSVKNYPFACFAKTSVMRVVFVAFVGLVGLFFVLPYLKTLTPDSESIFVRNELAGASLSIWKTSPIIGVGLGNFLVELPKYYPHRDIFFLQPVHNIYLLILTETGTIGVAFCLFFLWKLYKHITRKRLFDICLPALSSCRRQVQAGHLSFVILLLLGAADHYPLTLQQGQLLLTILMSFNLLSR